MIERTNAESSNAGAQPLLMEDSLCPQDLKTLLSHLSVGVCRFAILPSGHMQLVYLNPIACNWLEAAAAEVQENPGCFATRVAAGDRPRFSASLAQAQAMGCPWQWEGILDLPSGAQCRIEAIAYPTMSAAGKPVWDGTLHQSPVSSSPLPTPNHAHDSSTLDGALMEQLFSNFPGIAYRCCNDASWSMRFMSQGCQQLTGYRPEQLCHNQELAYNDLIHPDDQATVWEMVQAAIALKQPYQVIYRIRDAQGQAKWVWEQGSGIFTEAGELLELEGFILDITTQKRLEEMRQQSINELQNTQLFLQSVLENLPVAVVAKDAHTFEMVLWNQMAAQIFERPADAVLGKTDFELFPEALAQQYRATDLEAIAQSHILEIPLKETESNGETRLIQTWKARVLNSDRQPQYLLQISKDVTERIRIQECQRQSEARLRRFSAALGELVRSKTREQGDLQEGLQEITEVACQTLELAQAGIWIFESDRSVMRLLESYDRTSDSHVADLELQATDYPAYFEALAEQRLIAATDARIDPRTCEFLDTYLNPYGIVSLLDAPIWRRGEMVGVICLERQGQPCAWTLEEENFAGSLADFVSLVLESWDRKQAEAALRQETTHLENTLRELKQAQTHLIQSEKMSSLGQLVAGVAHEINNPVNFIYGNLAPAEEYIRDLLELIRLYQTQHPQSQEAIAQHIEDIELDFLVEDLPRLLNSMKLGAERIQTIVRSLRNFSRMDESEVKAVDIHEGIESTLLILQNRLKKRLNDTPIQVEKNYGNLPLVECFVGQLNQVFMNILGNALDALEEKAERLRAETKLATSSSSVNSSSANPELLEEASDWVPRIWIKTLLLSEDAVAIQIADNGPGLHAELCDRLFDPFFTTKPLGKGTGLGMSISYQIVTETHQGTLTCHSNPGQGAEFTITIPTRQPLTCQILSSASASHPSTNARGSEGDRPER